ncbi:MAG: hypothetical protein HQ567_12815, partial [Candidatus Nealsonbacteria bacterium]|nr:hypothetical protein [Candidatus Nealsonbacteria bacterium]
RTGFTGEDLLVGNNGEKGWVGSLGSQAPGVVGKTADVRRHTSRTISPIGESATLAAPPLSTRNAPRQSRLGSVTTVII